MSPLRHPFRFVPLLVGLALLVPRSSVSQSAGVPHDQLHAVLWMQRSAEYQACCLQVYNQARAQLDRALGDRRWTACTEQLGQAGLEALPPAIIADVDETVLDNSGFNARMIVDQIGFEKGRWLKWCEEQQATPIPGSLRYFNAARELGITVVYITNRKAGAEEAATRGNLLRLGYPLVEAEGEDLVLTKGEIGDKTARRRHICERYRVLALIGDNLGDFTIPVKPRKQQAPGEAAEAASTEIMRSAVVQELQGYWGSRWFILPNPAYGSWESVLLGQSKDKASLLRTRR